MHRVLEAEKLSHAYGFFGPKRIGKRTFAEELAVYIAPSKMERITLSGDSGSLSVEEVREARERLMRSSFGGGKKVLLIDEAHTMTVSAQNSLLKVLEEPKGDTLIMLVSSAPERLLDTILSRLVVMRFSALQDDEIRAALQGKSEPEQIEEITRLANGHIGLAFHLLQEEAFQAHTEHVAAVEEFFTYSFAQKVAYIEALIKAKDADRLHEFFSIARAELHSELIMQANPSRAQALQVLQEAEEAVRKNVNKQLSLERFARAV